MVASILLAPVLLRSTRVKAWTRRWSERDRARGVVILSEMIVAINATRTPSSSTASWLDLADALDELRERRDASAGLVPVVVLVRGVVAVLGQGETHEDDGADRPALTHEDGVAAEGELHGSLRSLDVGSRDDTLVCGGRRPGLDLD